MTLVPIQPHALNPIASEKLTYSTRPSEAGKQYVCRRTVALYNGPPHQIANRSLKSVWPNQFGKRLHIETQVLFADTNRGFEFPPAPVHSVHHSHPDQQLHYTLHREALAGIQANRSRVCLGANTYPAINTSCKFAKIPL